jgi:hypothetical protein
VIRYDYNYRRRHLDGTTGIASNWGGLLARRDDLVAWVFDLRYTGPVFVEPVSGRRGAATTTIVRSAPAAMRLWLWPDRPIRLYQQFDADGRCALYRVDFATPPWRNDSAIYQTDLYLDLFATADESDYAILDEDELEIAQQQGLIGPGLLSRILAQAKDLIVLLEARQLCAWLETFCPDSFELAMLVETPTWKYQKLEAGEPYAWPEVIS